MTAIVSKSKELSWILLEVLRRERTEGKTGRQLNLYWLLFVQGEVAKRTQDFRARDLGMRPGLCDLLMV